MKCPTCNKELGTGCFIYGSDERSMKKYGECFECSLWRERLPLVGNPDVAIIDGTFYTIGDEDDPSPFRGFGGDKFVIRFKDGREVVTTNLWCGGDISKAWKPKFPNNADFDWKWKKIGNTNYLVPKENEKLISQAETNIGKGIYYIQNTIDEIHSTISGYFETEAEAREGLKSCSDWFRPNGTGRIYFKEFGLHGKTTLIYESR